MFEHRDHLGTSLKFTEQPRKIISLVPSQSEFLWDLGLRDELVGITKFCIHPEELFRKKDRVGGTKKLNLEKIRSQFKGPEWSPMVRERSKTGHEDTDVYMKIVDGKMQGMFVLDLESKELDMVYIAGALDPSELSRLDGNFGIPKGVGGHTAKDGGK